MQILQDMTMVKTAQAQLLNNYTNAVWGAPGGSTSTTSNSGGGK